MRIGILFSQCRRQREVVNPLHFHSMSLSLGLKCNDLTPVVQTGTQELIGDITPAAGWNVKGCSPDWSDGPHAVNMTCEGGPNQTQHCGHLFNGGAENTIVRLPESVSFIVGAVRDESLICSIPFQCGTGPFARIVSINETDRVHTMQLDYNFKQIPPSSVTGHLSSKAVHDGHLMDFILGGEMSALK